MTETTLDRSLLERYEDAPDFEGYLDTVEKNRELWHGVWERATPPEEVVTRARALERPIRWLALSEDWCGDAVNVLPWFARLVEEVPEWELRILGRDANPDIMDAHLTDGSSRSIPVVIAYAAESFEELGWWGPRPADLQAWVLGPGRKLGKKDRYREIRRWFARDRGRVLLGEIVDLVDPEA